jgi:UDP-glucose 4-epimerase
VQTINVGTGRGYSVLDMVRAFEMASGQAVPYKIAARRAGDVAEYYADPARAAERLGWTASRDLDAMCRDAWAWQSYMAHKNS